MKAFSKHLGNRMRKAFVPFLLKGVEGVGSLLVPLHNRLRFYNELHIKFRLQKTDIVVATYAKSGTTWVLQILQQLTTDGAMDFAHIRDVCPFIEYNMENGVDFSMPDRKRRIYASHLPYKTVPKGPCKYIFVVRNPKDVLVSSYHHDQTSLKYQGSFSEYVAGQLDPRNGMSWGKFVSEWVANGENLDVLYIKYEDLKKDLRASVRRIADFCEIPVDDATLERVLERSSFSFMKKHEEKFDMNTYMIRLFGWSNTHSFIRKGEANGSDAMFSEEQLRSLQRNCEAHGLQKLWSEYEVVK